MVPIVHSTPGCAVQQHYAAGAGGLANPSFSGFDIPCSNVYEKQIIFGGASRLREQMKNAVKVFDGELYVVLSGCESEMVGDDVPAMTKELAEQGVPVIHYEAAGFKGSLYHGYEGVTDAVFTGLLPDAHEKAGPDGQPLVNVLGVIPGADLYWQGNLREIQRVFHCVGLRPNTLLGYGQGVKNWKEARGAKLSVVFSKWGLKAAETLKKHYCIPYIEVDGGFLGEKAGADFLRRLAGQVTIDERRLDGFIGREKGRFIYALNQIKEYYFDVLSGLKLVIVGDEGTVLRYCDFLTGFLDFSLAAAIVTDTAAPVAPLQAPPALSRLGGSLHFSSDTAEIAAIIAGANADLVLAGALERPIANKLALPLLTVSSPAEQPVILNRCDFGCNGALTLLEDLARAVKNPIKSSAT
jgi:nitrogenase molybdenum-iron protein beta chain